MAVFIQVTTRLNYDWPNSSRHTDHFQGDGFAVILGASTDPLLMGSVALTISCAITVSEIYLLLSFFVMLHIPWQSASFQL